MHQGNGNPIRLLVLAGPEVQASARWAAVPADASIAIVGDVYSAAVEVVRGRWDALLIDPGFLSVGAISLIEGSVRRHSLDVWIFETAANPALFHQALRAGAVPLSKVFKPEPPPQKRVEPWAPAARRPEPREPAPPPEPLEMTDEQAIRAALGYDNDRQLHAANGQRKQNPGFGLETIIESVTDPDQPVLTDAELRALLGDDEH